MRLSKFTSYALLAASAIALISCGSLLPETRAPASRTGNGASSGSMPIPRIVSAPPSATPLGNDRTCISQLGSAGVHFIQVPDTYDAPGCNKLGTVQLSSLAGDNTHFGVSNIGPVSCPVARAFSDWARFGVDRAARQILGSRLSRIETMGSYACRNVAGTERLSAHARAEAIDVSGFVLEDGRRIDLKRDWHGGPPAVREFLRVVHSSACKRFGTVLGPAFNDAHADHFHLEGTGPKFCR
jgi:hypothetical protein